MMSYKFAHLCFVVAAVAVAVANAGCNRTLVYVKTDNDLLTALKKAQPGHDIILTSGEYNAPSFTFGQSGYIRCPISLYCMQANDAIIHGSLVMEDINFVNISNIAIQPVNGEDPIHLITCMDVAFNNVHAYQGYKCCMHFFASVGVTIHNCTIDHCGIRGVHVWTSGVHIEDSLFGDGIVNEAIFVDNGGTAVITDNIFHGIGYSSSFPYWIQLYTGGNEVSRNRFSNSDKRAMEAGVWDASDLSSSDNLFKDNIMYIYPRNNNTYGFGFSHPKHKVCASNKVYESPLTNGVIDYSC